MGRPRKYFWSDWFTRKEFTLRKGRDFSCSTAMMVQQLRNAAASQGIDIQVKVLPGCRIKGRVNGRRA